MSHFLSIISIPRCELFYFGKEVRRANEVYDLVKESALSGESFDEFIRLFPSEEEGWGVNEFGARNLYNWFIEGPTEKYELWSDAYDAPMYFGPNQWWPYKGSIYSDKQEDIFSRVGYLRIEDHTDKVWNGKFRDGGLLQQEFENLLHWLKGHKTVKIKGLTYGN